ncbi:MAG: DNA-binding protein [Alteromonadaceae bacterium]|nr:MAG: DNA-binding protein [Alteromonadaceae bacterium]
MNDNKDYMTPKEAAALLRVSPITVRVWAQKDLLKASTTAGGHRRFERGEVERFAKTRGLNITARRANERHRVLIIDNDLQHLATLSGFLSERMSSAVVVQALTAFDAGRKLETLSPSIVLLDIHMSGIDGFQVCRAIRDGGDAKVFAMSSFITAKNRNNMIAAGAECCLEKPLDLERLYGLIQLDSEEAVADS